MVETIEDILQIEKFCQLNNENYQKVKFGFNVIKQDNQFPNMLIDDEGEWERISGSCKGQNQFNNCSYLVTFGKNSNGKYVFGGVYKVLNSETEIITNSEGQEEKHCSATLQKVDYKTELIKKLVVDWTPTNNQRRYPFYRQELDQVQIINIKDSENDIQIGEQTMPKAKGKPKNISLNQILYGPPGTGKTYAIQKIIEEKIYPQILTNNSENKNNYDEILSDYDLSWSEKIILSFKLDNQDNKPLTNNEITELPFLKRWYLVSNKYKNEHSFGRSVSAELQKCSRRNQEEQYKLHKYDYFMENNNKYILSDVGKQKYNEFCEEYGLELNHKNINGNSNSLSELAKEFYCFCTFHQSYSYEEFVEGIRPYLNKNDWSIPTEKQQFIGNDGIFKNMCTKAKKQPDKKFFIFIDEINRGNISKIFGELITLIEKDKREKVFDDGKEYNTIEVTLPYSQDKFTVPNNLYIIGTMNTADKSLALLDVALRRRFEFVPMYPKYVIDGLHHADFLKKLNDIILEKKGSADYLIGHAYFMGDEAEDLSYVLNKKVIPLLMEYFNNKREIVEKILTAAKNDLKFNDKVYHLEVE